MVQVLLFLLSQSSSVYICLHSACAGWCDLGVDEDTLLPHPLPDAVQRRGH